MHDKWNSESTRIGALRKPRLYVARKRENVGRVVRKRLPRWTNRKVKAVLEVQESGSGKKPRGDEGKRNRVGSGQAAGAARRDADCSGQHGEASPEECHQREGSYPGVGYS